MKRNSDQRSPVLEMDAGKFLHKINIGALSQISIFEDHIRRMGKEVNAEWKLVSLDQGSLMFEDQTGAYFHAKVSKVGQGKIKIEDIQQVKIVENKKSEMFKKNLEQLIECIADDDTKSADTVFNRIASQRFRSNVIPESGVVTTKDGMIRKISVSKNIVDESIKPRIVAAVREACKNNIKISRGRIVEAVFDDEKLKFPISELTRRRVVARSIKKIAENAYKSEGLQNRIKHIAGLVSQGHVDEAVEVAANFLMESQEFTLLNLSETRVLVENSLATQCCFNKQLSEDVGTLLYRTNCRVNRNVIVKEWRQTARKTEFAPLVENVRRLENSTNFEKDYQSFLKSVFTEDISTKLAKAHMYLSALRGMKKVLSGDESNTNILESLDEYIGRLQNAGDDVDDATVMEIEELVASTSESLLEDLETLADYDEIPEPLGAEPETFGNEDLGNEAGAGGGGGMGGGMGGLGGGLDAGMGGGLGGDPNAMGDMGELGGAGAELGAGPGGPGMPGEGGPSLPFGEGGEEEGMPPVPGAPGEEEPPAFESRKKRKSVSEGMVGSAVGSLAGGALGAAVGGPVGAEVGEIGGGIVGSAIGDSISGGDKQESGEPEDGLEECGANCDEVSESAIRDEINGLNKSGLVAELKAWKENSDQYFAEDSFERNSTILKALIGRATQLKEGTVAREFNNILVENVPAKIEDTILDPYTYRSPKININRNYGLSEDHATWPKKMKQVKPSGETGGHDSSREDDAAMGETGSDGADNVAPGGHSDAIVKGGHGPSDAAVESVTCPACNGAFSLMECMNAKGTSCPECGKDMYHQIMEALDLQENLRGAGHKMKRDTDAGGEGQGVVKQSLGSSDGRKAGGAKQKMDHLGGKGVAKKNEEDSDGTGDGGKKFGMEKLGGTGIAEDDDDKPWIKKSHKSEGEEEEGTEEGEETEEGVDEDQYKWGTRRRGPYNYATKGRGTIAKTENAKRNGKPVNEATTIVVTDKPIDDVIARIVDSVGDDGMGGMDSGIDGMGGEIEEVGGDDLPPEDAGMLPPEGDGVVDSDDVGEVIDGAGSEFPSTDGLGAEELPPGAEGELEGDLPPEDPMGGGEEIGGEEDEVVDGPFNSLDGSGDSEDEESEPPSEEDEGGEESDDGEGDDDGPPPPPKKGPPKPKKKEKKEEMSEDNDITSPTHKDYDTKEKANKDGDGKEMRKSPKFSSTDYDGTKEVKTARPQGGK